MKYQPAEVWRNNQNRRRFLGAQGKVLTFSRVSSGPEQLQTRTPYYVALVAVGREKVVAQLVDVEELRAGMRVVGVLRRMFEVDSNALHVYGVKFSPVRKIS